MAASASTLRLRYDNNASQLMRRSDHWPFLNRGVPGVWIHSGLHPDYHTANDDADRINYPKMEKITRLVYQAAWDLASSSARPALGKYDTFGPQQDGLGLRYLSVGRAVAIVRGSGVASFLQQLDRLEN